MNHPNAPMRGSRVVKLDSVELRAGEGQPPKIVGHAALYNVWSSDLGGFKERILPGAFSKTLVGSDIRALFNHDENYILGRNKAGTLRLTDEAKGLHFEADAPDTQTIRDLVLAPMERGDLDQCSFAFTIPTGGDEWREPRASGLWERDISEAQLWDVSVVTFPAYTQTDAALRSFSEFGVDLAGVLIRARRGLELTESDFDLLRGSIEVLQAYLPTGANADEASGANADEASRSIEDTETRPLVAHLRRLLDHEAALLVH